MYCDLHKVGAYVIMIYGWLTDRDTFLIIVLLTGLECAGKSHDEQFIYYH